MKFLMNKNFWLSFFQPYLISIYPAIVVAGGNLGQFDFIELFLYVFLLFFFIVSLHLFFSYIYKDYNKGSLILSIFLIFFYGFHHFANVLLVPFAIFTQKYFFKFQIRYSFVLVVFLLGYFFWKLFKIKRVHYIYVRILIFPLIIIYAWVFAQTIVFYWNLNFEIKKWNSLHSKICEESFSNLTINKKYDKSPDVYYIILDKYASPNVLMEYLGQDLSWFTDKLKSKGFFIAEDSCCNYVSTEKSLSSSLNMSHHNSMDPNFFGISRYLIKHNLVSKIFKKLNYKYVYVGYDISFKIETELNKNVFEQFNDDLLFLVDTAFKPYSFLSYALGASSLLYYPWFEFEGNHHKNVVLRSLLNLKRAIRVPGPKFVFAHIVCPHGPYIFDRNGSYKSQKFNDGYAQQIEFISNKMEKLIDLILSENKNSIIILQGDHGFFEPSSFREINGLATSSDSVKTLYHILNAYYFPNLSDSICFDKSSNNYFNDSRCNLYNTVSPVNSFRILFNKYFDTKFELLSDDSFSGPDQKGKFKKLKI